MSERKYREYFTIVEYPNGEKDTIEYIDERKIDTTNYKEMLSVYGQTKKEYMNKYCTIRFMGRSESEEFVEMFSKSIEPEDSVETISLEECVDNLSECMNLLTDSIKEIHDSNNLAEKRVSEFYHIKVEVSSDDLSDEEKINRFDELKDLLVKRRETKIEKSKVSSIQSEIGKISCSLKTVMDRVGKVEKRSAKAVKQIKSGEGKAYDKNSVKEYKYNNFKERMNLMKQLTPKFDKVVNDDDRKVLCCYDTMYNR